MAQTGKKVPKDFTANPFKNRKEFFMFRCMLMVGFIAIMMSGCSDESINDSVVVPASSEDTMNSYQNNAITFLRSDDAYIYISFCNTTDAPVKISCYDGAKGGRLIRDPDFEVFIDNNWKHLELMYCGTGADDSNDITIEPQRSEMFTVDVSFLKERYPTPLTLKLILLAQTGKFVSNPYVLND